MERYSEYMFIVRGMSQVTFLEKFPAGNRSILATKGRKKLGGEINWILN